MPVLFSDSLIYYKVKTENGEGIDIDLPFEAKETIRDIYPVSETGIFCFETANLQAGCTP